MYSMLISQLSLFAPLIHSLISNFSQINLTLTTEVYIFQNYLIISQQNDKTLQLIRVKVAF